MQKASVAAQKDKNRKTTQMKQKYSDIVIRNFFRLIRSGAFNEYEPIERMSDYKWRQLLGIVVRQNVVAITVNGIRNSQYDNAGNIPKYIVNEFFDLQNKVNASSKVSIPQPSMSNLWLNKRLKKIRHNEHHAIDTSSETLEMLNIIVYNTNQLLTYGISFGNIVLIGKYLRSRGGNIDFVKLDHWLKLLGLRNIAQFEGNILISTLHFSQDEIPFVNNGDAKAYRRSLRALSTMHQNNPEQWQIQEGRSGFIYADTGALRQNVWHKLKYLRYAPIETMSNLLQNIASSLSKIEE